MGKHGQLITLLCAAMLALSLSACTNSNGYVAPAVNANLFDVNPQGAKLHSSMPFLPDHYVVQAGETVTSIAAKFGVDPNDIIRLNNLSAPYDLHAGQVISFRQLETHRSNPQDNMVIVPVTAIKPVEPVKPVKTAQPHTTEHHRKPRHPSLHHSQYHHSSSHHRGRHHHVTHHAKPHHHKVRHVAAKTQPSEWLWPVHGKIAKAYSPQLAGIEIKSQHPSDVLAARAGTVIFAQDAVAKYGNMVIIAHQNKTLSAYAHNQSIVVHSGEMVKQGQKIATLGNGKGDYLYFEIRRDGRAVDPLNYLSNHS